MTDNEQELVESIKGLLPKMRLCNDKTEAVAWMASAYDLLNRCAREFERPVVHGVAPPPRSVIILPEQPKIIAHVAKPLPVWFNGQTVVYPQKAWTHKDTLRMERLQRERERMAGIDRQRLGSNRQYGVGR